MGRLKDHVLAYAEYSEISFEEAMQLPNEVVLNWNPPSKVEDKFEEIYQAFYNQYEITKDYFSAWKFVVDEFQLSASEEQKYRKLIEDT